jgi:hypothetical protein
MDYTSAILGFIVGAMIGLTFAWMQIQALRRNEMIEQQQVVSGWMKQIPGAGGRVAFLLMAFVLAQVVMQLLFHQANLPWMTAGVVLAYGIPFTMRLIDKYSGKR